MTTLINQADSIDLLCNVMMVPSCRAAFLLKSHCTNHFTNCCNSIIKTVKVLKGKVSFTSFYNDEVSKDT